MGVYVRWHNEPKTASVRDWPVTELVVRIQSLGNGVSQTIGCRRALSFSFPRILSADRPVEAAHRPPNCFALLAQRRGLCRPEKAPSLVIVAERNSHTILLREL